MNLKRSPFAIQDNKKVLDNAIDSSTLNEFMKEQNLSSKETNSVHYRRDLDSLG